MTPALLLAMLAAAAVSEECETIPDAASLLRPGVVVLLGEIHGTVEAPRAASSLACEALDAGLEVTIGLEIPQEEQDAVDRYMQSRGTDWDRIQAMRGDFWQRDYQDGRGSSGMLDLVESLRRANSEALRVVLIDNPNAPNRDHFMATRLQAEIAERPRSFVVVLTGNLHSQVTTGSALSVDYAPMGYQLTTLLPETEMVSLDITHEGGTAWVCTPDECGVVHLRGNDSAPLGVHIDVHGEHTRAGRLHVGAITASPPAKTR
jgi:hypothetical protein